MQGLEIIREGDAIHAIILRRDFIGKDKYNFLTPPDFPLQLGANKYSAGEEIKKHYHPDKETRIRTVQEFIIVSKGRLKVFFFNEALRCFRETILETGDMILLTRGGHGFETLAETTLVEIKQGPYDGTKDKIIF